MQQRPQSVLVQVCLALVCALGAGLSGDMQARHAGPASHHARHARGGQQRGVRSSNRDNNGDHAQEIEVTQDAAAATQAATGHSSVAILARPSSVNLQWIQVATAVAVSAGFPTSVELLSIPSRGPPVLS